MDPMTELPDDIARALAVLAARAARRAAAVDPERVAERVVARLKDEPAAAESPERRWLSAPRSLRVAAAVTLFVVAGTTTLVMVRGGSPPVAAPAAVALPVAIQGADSLSQSEQEAVLKALEGVRTVNGAAPRPSTVLVEDLSETELRALLQAMQASEGAI